MRPMAKASGTLMAGKREQADSEGDLIGLVEIARGKSREARKETVYKTRETSSFKSSQKIEDKKK